MALKNFSFLFLLLIPVFTLAQINLKVLDESGNAVSDVNISYNSQNYFTDVTGSAKIPLASSEQVLRAEKEGFRSFSKNIKTSPKVQYINILFVKSERETEIKEIVFQKKAKPKKRLTFIRF